MGVIKLAVGSSKRDHPPLATGNRKDASLANPTTSDARSVMLRIPLPEDDGFALPRD